MMGDAGGKSGRNGAAENRSSSDRNARTMETRVGWRLAGVGMQAASEVMAGALIGWLIDRWRGHGSAFLLTGAIIGIIVAMWTLLKVGLRLNRELDAKYPVRGRGKSLREDRRPKDTGRQD